MRVFRALSLSSHIINLELHPIFKKKKFTISQMLPYDYRSVMHYKPKLNSSNTESVMVPVSKSVSVATFGQSDFPTCLDYLHINLLYCGGKHKYVKNMLCVLCLRALFTNCFAYLMNNFSIFVICQ